MLARREALSNRTDEHCPHCGKAVHLPEDTKYIECPCCWKRVYWTRKRRGSARKPHQPITQRVIINKTDPVRNTQPTGQSAAVEGWMQASLRACEKRQRSRYQPKRKSQTHPKPWLMAFVGQIEQARDAARLERDEKAIDDINKRIIDVISNLRDQLAEAYKELGDHISHNRIDSMSKCDRYIVETEGAIEALQSYITE